MEPGEFRVVVQKMQKVRREKLVYVQITIEIHFK